MVKPQFAVSRAPVTMAVDPERMLALAYVPAPTRPAIAALWRLDVTLAGIVRSTTEPMIGQMRLSWWHDALAGLASSPVPAEPLLREIAATIGGDAARLTSLIEGWEALLDPLPLSAAALDAYSAGRGALFTFAADAIGEPPTAGISAAGRLWALVDLAFNVSDRSTAEAALTMAAGIEALPGRWPSALRSIGVLTVLARRDLAHGLDRPRRIASPARVARALAHRLTGI